MLIDTHAHLNFSAYKNDVDEVIKRTLDNNIWMINVGSQYSTSKRAVELAGKYEKGVWAAVGLHPIHSQDEFVREKYKELARSKKVVAIGEIGLDYKFAETSSHLTPHSVSPSSAKEYVPFKKRQREVFLQQLKLAEELDLPVIFHCRMAHADLLEVINSKFKIQNSKLNGVVHCFTGTWEQAIEYLDMGFYLGFNGIIFKLNLDEIIKKIPLDKILIETDCPYLTPPQIEGRNEPLYVKYVAEKIAQIKKLSYDKISAITTENAIKLFKLYG